MIRVHQRQFVIARQPIDLPQWRSLPLAGDLFLSHDSELAVRSEADGRIVLGHRLLDGEAGRYVVLDWPFLSGDAAMLLPVLFGRTETGPIVTSSAALAARFGHLPPSARRLGLGGVNWFPSPGTRIRGLYRLLRDQRLHLPSLSVEHVDRAIRPCRSYADAVELASTHLMEVARAIRGARIVLAMTAGLDSRTLAAALLAEGVAFDAITLDIDAASRVDVQVASRICKRMGIEHRVIRPAPRDESAARLFQEHTLISHYDRDHTTVVPHGLDRFRQSGTVYLRGACFEIGRCFYARPFRGLDTVTASAPDIWERMTAEEPDADTLAALDAWLQWRRRHDDGLQLMDSFYLDQRIGAFIASAEQGLDSMPGDPLSPANSARMFSALITPDERERRAGTLQKDVIRALCPELLRLPFNPAPPRKRISRLVKRTLKKLRPTR